jgi:hypothetical protein
MRAIATLPQRASGLAERTKSTERPAQDLVHTFDTYGMTKSVAASVVWLLPLLAACASESTSRCAVLSQDVLVEVSKDSQPDNVGKCSVPNAFRLGALGCGNGTTYSADRCVVKYDLDCVGGVSIEMTIKQADDGSIKGTLSKFDQNRQCQLDLDIEVKNTPAVEPPADDEE